MKYVEFKWRWDYGRVWQKGENSEKWHQSLEADYAQWIKNHSQNHLF
jgi:hypothetical protein